MAQSDEEEDYMNMVFEDPRSNETTLQRRMRIEREGSSRGYNKSKAERQADAIAARENALDTALDSSNKGFKMMAKLGFKPGGVLGKSESALKEPIRPKIMERRSGIGNESDRKRKFREMAEKTEQDDKMSVSDYRAYKRRIQEDKRAEAIIVKAQKTAEQLEEQREQKEASEPAKQNWSSGTVPSKPLKSIHVTWRGFVRRRLESKQADDDTHSLQMARKFPARYFHNSDEDDEDDEDKTALGGNAPIPRELVDDLEDDEELEAFEALPVEDRLKQLLAHLRHRFHYCYWCAEVYANSDMDGCPGESEEDHDIV